MVVKMKTHELMHELTQTAAVFGRSKDVSLFFEGDGAYTTGKEIVLPSIAHGADLSHEAVMVLRGYLDHEAGHVRHTDFEAMQKFGDTQSSTCFEIWNCLEDMWLERKVMAEYPGAEKNLRVLTDNVCVKEKEYMDSHKDEFEGVTPTSVKSAILRAGRLDYSGELNKEMFEALPSKLQEWGKKWVEEVHKCRNSSEVMNMAIEIEKLLNKTQEDKEPKPDNLEGMDPADFKFDKDGDITSGKPVPEKMEGEGKGQPIKSDELGEFIKEFIKSETDKSFEAKATPLSQQYKVLSTRWDEVYTRNSVNARKDRRQKLLKEGTAADYDSIKTRLGGQVNVMKAKLRRALMAKELRDWDFGREYGKLDTKRLVAGLQGNPSVYKQRKERLDMDTAVHLLVDLSGSMRGRKISVACESVIAFAECLEGTQLRYQISGFDHSGGPKELGKMVYEARTLYHRVEPQNIFKYKSFNEPLQVAKGSVAAIRHCVGINNADRDAVLWAMEELKRRPERRKILFVLSDGMPENATIRADRGHLVTALKMAVDECPKHGVECVGIGILTNHVKHLYPKSVAINDVSDLSGAIFNQLSNLLTGGRVNL